MKRRRGDSLSVRKNYTIRKEREVWSPTEHERFVAALALHGRKWKMIEAAVGTKTIAQIRSHAQKHYEKTQSNADSSPSPNPVFGANPESPPPSPSSPRSSPPPSSPFAMKRRRGDSLSVRKNYTIRKEREVWSPTEHERFVAALALHGRKWKMIEAAVGTKTIAQIRSHAQKHYEKTQSNADSSPSPNPVFDQDTTITLPWLVTPDVLAGKSYLLQESRFRAWMSNNNLLPPEVPVDQSPAPIVSQHNEVERTKHIREKISALEPLPSGTTAINWQNVYAYVNCKLEGRTLPPQQSLTPTEHLVVRLLLENLLQNMEDATLRQSLEATLSAISPSSM
eukprot:TRINITY_DN2648_c0_g1_i1.p1 TRINITY_DN2648_c0_g1~~TRINITY_DN2648_c0_g1_i1.p1  ORF type:complete len:370 (+),score=87.79 TRINITY_DN2648_c0_g1_i1:98-1111(+)